MNGFYTKKLRYTAKKSAQERQTRMTDEYMRVSIPQCPHGVTPAGLDYLAVKYGDHGWPRAPARLRWEARGWRPWLHSMEAISCPSPSHELKLKVKDTHQDLAGLHL